MPAAIAAPAIGAAGSLAAGVLGSRAQSKATDASLQAQREALAYEKQKDAERKAEYDKAMKMYQAQMEAWQGNRRALARRYGINVPEPSPMPGPGPGGPMPGGAVPRGIAPRRSALTLGAIAGQAPPQEAPMMPQAPMDVDPSGWEDWSRYAPVR
jgi:hypothetical protein